MKTILLATDFSPASNNAADYALELAKYFDSKLILLNAYPLAPANYDTGLAYEAVTEIHKSSEDGLTGLKNRLQKTNVKGIDIECLSVMGSTMDVIEEICKNKNIDLVVMGIVSNAGKIKEHLIGSTSLKAARHLSVPMFIIPDGVKYKRIRKISFACGLKNPEQASVIYIAKFFAKAFDAELEVINIEKPYEERSEEKAMAIEFVEEKLENVKHKTFMLADEDATLGLEEHYEQYPSDVIILNPKKHNIIQTLLGTSVTRNLMFHSKLPLLIIH